MNTTIFPLLFVGLFAASAESLTPYRVFDPYHGLTSKEMIWLEYTDANNSLYHYLKATAFQSLSQRRALIETIQTQKDWENRRGWARATLQQMLGSFPAKTALQARTVATIEKPTYRVENVIFESIPGLYVTASLFIPNGIQSKAPAILYCSGHTRDAYRHPRYQQVILNLVDKGFVVFAFDPIGQGERLDYMDPVTGTLRFPLNTRSHSYMANQCFLSGSSLATYFAWDGMRAIDYLISRPEVDSDRVGIHGNSGGGLQSALIAALDDRVQATAVCGYTNTYEWLLKSQGIGDGEQNFFHAWANQFDIPDLIVATAPKPYLIMATTRDFFPIMGARDAYQDAMKAYISFERSDHLLLFEDDGYHGYTKSNREAMYGFFQRFLQLPGDPSEIDAETLTAQELKITETGQVSTSLGGETIFTLNRSETEKSLKRIEQSRQNPETHLQRVREVSRKLSGYQEPPSGPIHANLTGRYRETIIVEKFFIHEPGRYPIPFLLLHPNDGQIEGSALFLNPQGKLFDETDLAYPYLETLLSSGHAVLIPDLINSGEVGPVDFRGDGYIDGYSSNIWYMAANNGISIAGLQASDISQLTAFLKTRFPKQEITAVSYQQTNVALLHAAALNTSIQSVVMIEPLASYASIALNEYYDMKMLHTLTAGALQHYDLQDLAACIAPRKLLILNPVDQNGDHLSADDAKAVFDFTQRFYQQLQQSGHFLLHVGEGGDPSLRVLRNWVLQPSR
jgi:dienelactone hydrolase